MLEVAKREREEREALIFYHLEKCVGLFRPRRPIVRRLRGWGRRPGLSSFYLRLKYPSSRLENRILKAEIAFFLSGFDFFYSSFFDIKEELEQGINLFLCIKSCTPG